MRNKRYVRERGRHFGKVVISLIVVAVIVVSSFVTVMANTVPCTVADGDEVYSFSLLSPALEDIVAKAESEGMPPLDSIDKVRMDGEKGQVVVDRGMRVDIAQDGVFLNVVAYEGDTVADALKKAEVSYSEKDRIDPAAETLIEGDMAVTLESYTGVTVSADGKDRKADLYGGTVAEALKALKVILKSGDRVSPVAETALTDGMSIKVERQKAVEITDGGKKKSHKTFAADVSSALKELGYKLEEEDRVSVSLKDKLADGMKIAISRVTYEEGSETQGIEYDTVYEEDSSIYAEDSYTKTEGVEGEKTLYYRDIYVDGAFEEREIQREEITREPVTAVVVTGTKAPKPAPTPAPAPGGGSSGGGGSSSGQTFTDSSGNQVSYSNVMTGECTAYSDPGGITSLGEACQVGVVAVNPDVIPYGTRLYITSGNVVYGYAVAGDTGGAALSNRILVDVYYDSEEECYNFGRRDMTVYILD